MAAAAVPHSTIASRNRDGARFMSVSIRGRCWESGRASPPYRSADTSERIVPQRTVPQCPCGERAAAR
jgi:hypothetical protein